MLSVEKIVRDLEGSVCT